MTTLFSVFGPFFLFFSMKLSLMLLLITSISLWILICLLYLEVVSSYWVTKFSTSLFSESLYTFILFSFFAGLGLINLFSLMVYSYPITTTLGFNLSAAFSCWLGSMMLQSVKSKFISSFLPMGSPWYLVPFLSMVELVSITVRPVTLCFRLLANMTAGHVLISLICKMEFVWVLGVPFGVLELMVALVQGFVFSMLISVYLEESFSH